MESEEIYQEREKQRLMDIYEHGNRKARREAFGQIKRTWKRQEKGKARESAKKAIEQRTK